MKNWLLLQVYFYSAYMTLPAPKITIITPTFNVGQTIDGTLQTIASQTWRNLEHLIIDGASTDDTVERVMRFRENFPHILLFSEPDEGIYHAMNKGLERCTGDWICFLGAGDGLYHDCILEELVNVGFFRSEQIVYGDVLIRGEAGWARDGQVYDGPFDLQKLFKRNICHQGIFYPRSTVHTIGFYNPVYKVTADWDYNVHCRALYPFTYAGRIISFFTAGGRSAGADDHSFYKDMPEKVIEYFQLDPNDEAHRQPDSPFYLPVKRYREKYSGK